MPQNYELFNLTDTGKLRSNNEDYFATYQNKEWLLLILCDGMGGVKGGRIASTITVKTIGEYFKNNFNDPLSFFEESVAAANKAILDRTKNQPQLKGMGSTLVLVLYNDKEVFYAHVGDSRLYLFRNNKLVQLTRDHSYVNEMVERGLIKREDAQSHEYKNRITRCIGQVNSKPTISSVPYKVQENDIFMMCSDGLTDMVEDRTIENIFKSTGNIELLAKKLIDEANANGGKDNITVQILRVTHKPQNGIRLKRRENKTSIKKPFIFVGATVLLLLAVWQGIQNIEVIKKTANDIFPAGKSNLAAALVKASKNDFMLIGWEMADTLSNRKVVRKFNYFLPAGALIGYLSDSGRTPVISKGLPTIPEVSGKPLSKALAVLDSFHFRLQHARDSIRILKLDFVNHALPVNLQDSMIVKSCDPPQGNALSASTEIRLIVMVKKKNRADLPAKTKAEAQGDGR